MKIIDFFTSDNQAHWLEQISRCDWGAGQYLHELLAAGRLKELCGQSTRLFLLTEDTRLISFCTLAEEDDVRGTGLGPWIGFVYTYPPYRGRGNMGRLLEAARRAAQADGAERVYISTNETGLYERYGYAFYGMMKDMRGEDTRVYAIDLRPAPRLIPAYDRPEDTLRLFREYTDGILAHGPEVAACLSAQGLDEELRDIRGIYAPPKGRLYLALLGDEPAGCAALRPLDDKACEMKRLYVRPACRGHHIGRLLVEKIIEEARAIGYKHIRLDTFPFMQSAIRMYRGYDFYEIGPYNKNPAPSAIFLQKDLF